MRNVLKEYGFCEDAITQKLNNTFYEIFENNETRLYHEQDDTGYIMDTGNVDVRTEGMSYGMMAAVQMGRQDIFDRLWKWSKLHMWQEKGPFSGYFAWSCSLDGTKNSEGPAPDGEEYYAMALFFASHKFGDRESPFDYSRQAKDIIHAMINKGRLPNTGEPMFNSNNKLILFVPGCPFSDPSYHLPHFYELFARWCYEEDKDFMLEAAAASRQYLRLACHPITGLASDYAHFDGSPVEIEGHVCHTHYSDSYRVALNIGLDALWFGKDIDWQSSEAEKLQDFYIKNPHAMTDTAVTIDGKPYPEPIMHPLALLSTASAISAARSKNPVSEQLINKFMETDLRKDERRYYDNFIYFFSLLALSGRYKTC